jgi:hypothetical protein
MGHNLTDLLKNNSLKININERRFIVHEINLNLWFFKNKYLCQLTDILNKVVLFLSATILSPWNKQIHISMKLINENISQLLYYFLFVCEKWNENTFITKSFLIFNRWKQICFPIKQNNRHLQYFLKMIFKKIFSIWIKFQDKL